MEHNRNESPAATTSERDFAETPAAPPTAPPSSDRLVESLVGKALECGRDRRPGRARRVDGWTPDRIRAFLASLARTGVVAEASRAAGMSKQSAYALRNRPGGRAFDLAWTEVQRLARRPSGGPFMSRAIYGYAKPIIRDGRIWGLCHRFDNRHTMATLTRLNRIVASIDKDDDTIRIVAEEFDRFVEIVCSGDADAADAFIAARRAEERQ